MFSFQYHILSDLPKLAWCTTIEKESSSVTVLSGKKVECQDRFFVSGVWDGSFSDGRFDRARFFCGSGMIVEDDGLRCCTPSHALEKVFLVREDNSIILSNSLPFILAVTGYELDDRVNQYEQILCSILDGVNNYQYRVPLANKCFVEQYFVSDILISNDFEIVVQRKESVSDFKNFEDYYGNMLEDLQKIAQNASSLDRKERFGVVSTISGGYDSCACAAMAKKLGCSRVVTLSGGKYDVDDGTIAAAQLGYQEVVKRQQSSYRFKTGCIDAEYVCSGELGTHLQFSVFEDMFANNLVFMGLRGDYYWGKKTVANNDFEMHDFFYYETNIGYIENALKNGYIVIPLPTYGSGVAKSVREVTQGEEMKPWTLNNDYDRPIPRRIVEQSGVSRESFGQKKSGGGFSFGYDTKKTVKRKMTEDGYADFIAFTQKTKRERESIVRFIEQIRYTRLLLPTYLNRIFQILHMDLKLKQKTLRMSNPGTPSDLIFWGMSRMIERYSNAMKG